MNERNEHSDELLPWYANGTLADGERRRVEAHLRDCGRCRQEVAWWQDLRAQIRAENTRGFGELGLHRLLRDARAGTAPPPSRWWRPALTAAVVVIAIQSVVLIDVMNRPAAIAPLGGRMTDGVVLQVRFAPHATEAQIRQLLQKTRASLIDGPGALGIYRVRLDGIAAAQDPAIQRVVDELTVHRDVVAYAARE